MHCEKRGGRQSEPCVRRSQLPRRPHLQMQRMQEAMGMGTGTGMGMRIGLGKRIGVGLGMRMGLPILELARK